MSRADISMCLQERCAEAEMETIKRCKTYYKASYICLMKIGEHAYKHILMRLSFERGVIYRLISWFLDCVTVPVLNL